MERAELFDFLISKTPETEHEIMVWGMLASRHLYLTKKDPFRNHHDEIKMIEELAKIHGAEYPNDEIIKGWPFIDNLIKETSDNDEIKKRATERINGIASAPSGNFI